MFMDVFDALPISAYISKKYLAVHGGISPELKKIEQIQKIDRFVEIPLDGLLCDLLWSDPMDDEEGRKGDWRENP